MYKEFNNFNAISFKVDDQNYIYDSYSNQILKVDPVVVDIIDDTFEMSKEDILNKYNDRYSEDEISNALYNISECQKNADVFRKFTISELSLSSNMSTIDKIKEKLKGHLCDLILNVTEDCNFRCEYCIYSGNYENRRTHNKSNNLEWDVAKNAIDYYLTNSSLANFRHISFYGGEPFLRFKLIKKVVEYSKEKAPDLIITVTTNGSLLSEDILEFVEKNNIQINLSFDGPKNLHNRYRKFKNNKLSYDIIVEKLALMKNKFPDIYHSNLRINAVAVPSEDENDIDELNRFFSDEHLFEFLNKAYEKLSIGLLNNSKNSFFTKHNYSDFCKKFFSKMNELFIHYHANSLNTSKTIVPKVINSRLTKLIHFRSNKKLSAYEYFWPNGICIPGIRSIMVTSDGSFYPCEKMYDFGRMKIGNIYEGLDYDKIACYIDEYRKAAIHQCKDCWLFRLCGVCYMSFFNDDDNGSSLCHKSRLQSCISQRNAIARFLKMYISILSKNNKAFDYVLNDADKKNDYVRDMIND